MLNCVAVAEDVSKVVLLYLKKQALSVISYSEGHRLYRSLKQTVQCILGFSIHIHIIIIDWLKRSSDDSNPEHALFTPALAQQTVQRTCQRTTGQQPEV
jgi:hypothetical protein